MASLSLITIQADDLPRLIRDAVRDALDAERNAHAADGAGLSLNGAAKVARRRREILSAALQRGTLVGRRYGSNPERQRWSIIAADVRDWLQRGCP